MTDRKTIMSWLEGLAEPNWRMFHSDSEVQNIAKETLNLLKEQEEAHKILVEKADEMYAMLKEQGKSGCDGCIYKGSDNCPLDMTDERNFICPNGKLNIT